MARLHATCSKSDCCAPARSTTVAAVLAAVIAITLGQVASVPPALGEPGGQTVQARACPEGYSLIDLRPAFCLGKGGDVIEPQARYRPASAPGYPTGYDRMDELCIGAATGDVVLVRTDAHALR